MRRTTVHAARDAAPARARATHHSAIEIISSLGGSDRLPELKSHLFSQGAKAFLQKPYQLSDVLRVIRGVIDVADRATKEMPS
jgi:FixJ family two-component response regulator